MKQLSLTPEQEAVIAAPRGHYLVTAVAGSGKTTTLAFRIAHLLAGGADPRRVLVLMFNKAAQQEFSLKLQHVLPPQQTAPEVRTFHAMAYRFYQRLVQLGHLPPFGSRILQEGEMQLQFWRLAQQVLTPEQGKLFRRNKKEYLELCLRFCDGVKSQLLSAELFFEEAGYDADSRWLLALFDAFEAWRRQQGRISYADMLHAPIMLLQQQPALQALLSNKMDTVLVDEYQDTNRIQHEWLKLIAGERADVMAVGDPDQTIYEFRGARPEYMIGDFIHDFPDAHKLTLSVSFRYGHGVALLANHLIQHNRGRQNILCQAAPDNPATQLHWHQSAHQERQLVQELSAVDTGQLADCCVLLRTWSQAGPIELALLQSAIPYRIAAHRSVFQQSDFHALRELLRLAAGQVDHLEARSQALATLLKFPHVGVAESRLHTLAAHAAAMPGKLGRALALSVPSEAKKFQQKKMRRLADLLAEVEACTAPVSRWLRNYAEQSELLGAVKNMGLSHEQAAERDASLRALLDYVCSLPGDANAVLAHLDMLNQRATHLNGEGVVLTSIHQAKGLEWPHVFIPGLQQGQLPYQPRKEALSAELLESERRLLYVAMTRAQHSLHVFAPSAAAKADALSRFQQELCFELSAWLGAQLHQGVASEGQDEDARILHLPATHTASGISQQYAAQQACTLIAARQEALPIWQARRVHHRVFGEGNIVGDEGTSFSVSFDSGEQRQFSKDQAERHFTLPAAVAAKAAEAPSPQASDQACA